MEEFSEDWFSTAAEVVQRLNIKSDDVQGVVIPVAEGIYLDVPESEPQFARDAAAFIQLLDGRSLLIPRDEAEKLINDGILQRLGIPCTFRPIVKVE